VQKAQLDLEYCQIKSPIDGRAGARMVDPGNVVTGGGPDGGTKLLRIEAFDPIYADFTITENELGTVRKFMAEGRLPQQDPQGHLKVLVDVPGDAKQIVQALGRGPVATMRPSPEAVAKGAAQENPGRKPGASPEAEAPTTRPAGGAREGVLTFLDNAVVEGAGTVRVRATVPNADRYFWPGQFVRVKLVLTIKKDAVLIPTTAQQIGQTGPYVYVVEQGTIKDAKGQTVAAEVARLRPIQLGQKQGDMVVVEQGLKAGDRVVVEGQLGVTPDGAVNPIPQAKAQKTAVAEGR
jgi:multidrug efflux system membrane fusion protein